MADPVEDLLRRSQLNDRQRAGLWDLYQASKNADDLTARLKSMDLPRELKADLWELKAKEELTALHASNKTMADSLPSIGGTLGSMVGGTKSNPLGMLLAAVGGAGGEGYRQTLAAMAGKWDEVPPDVQSQISAIVTEGIKQGGIEGMGRYILGPVAKLFGRAMYRSALKPPKAVRDEFGAKEVTNTLVEAGVPITRSGKGTAQVESMLRESGKDTAQTIAAAEAAGVPGSTMRPIVKSLDRTRGDVSQRVVRSPALQQVQEFRDLALKENPGVIPPTRMQGMKQAEQDLAINAYKAEARGVPINNLETSMHEDLARGLREAIERRIPSIANKNARTQDIIGALRAITAAEGRIANNNLIGMGDMLSLGTGMGAFAATGRPTAAALGILQEVLTRPEIASRLGIALDRAGGARVSPQALRAVYEAVNQLGAQEPQ